MFLNYCGNGITLGTDMAAPRNPTRFRYNNGVLIVSVVPATSYAAFYEKCKDMTIFQECPLWLYDALRSDDGPGVASTVFSCTMATTGGDGADGAHVVVGYAKTLLRETELTIAQLCAFVPRQCVGVSLLHAAVAHGFVRGAKTVDLHTSFEAVPFYERLSPCISTSDGYMKWTNARALLATLAERVGTCVVRSDAFWFKTYMAYAQFMETGVYNAIIKTELVDAAREDDVDTAVDTLDQFYRDFVNFVHANKIDIPELAALPEAKRRCLACGGRARKRKTSRRSRRTKTVTKRKPRAARC
jgi:hypothetical protein